MKARPSLVSLCAGLACACVFASAGAQTYEMCGSLENAYGPFDYRSAPRSDIEIVTRHHLLPEQARSAPDIDYTLRAIPNHPQALQRMVSFAEYTKNEKVGRYSVSCWFSRAVRFQPSDPTPRLLFGIYLARRGERSKAIEQFEEARDLAGEADANLHYNLGLVYFDVKDYAKSLQHAQKAYALGFPLPGLKNKLQRAGKWQERAPSAAAATQQRNEAERRAADEKTSN